MLPAGFGMVLIAIGFGGIAGWWLGATPWATLITMAGGAALLVLVGISAAGLGPALWILSGATYLRILAMVATPWRIRWTVDWRSLEAVLALALVTAGVLPILIVASVEHLTGAVDATTLAERQVRFGAAALALLIVAIAGIVGGRLLARPIADLRIRVSALPLGAADRPNDSVEVSELAAIGRALDETSAALIREQQHKDQLIAALQERNRELAEATAAKDEFLGMVSHELKTPITTIMGNAEVLRKRAALIDEESRSAALADIGHDAERLNRIIANLLMLARVDRGAAAEWEPILMKHLLDRMVEEHRQQHPYRTIRLEREGAPAPVIGVIGYVEQVLQNLLSNAEKYSPADQPIDVVVRTADEHVEVRVLDRGSGIPPDEVDQLFTAFYRSPRTSGSAKGVGIGLAVCKRLIEAQRGTIWVQARQGGGTEFGFSLPAASQETEA